MDRKAFIHQVFSFTGLLSTGHFGFQQFFSASKYNRFKKPLPVIFDTDIGDDIDDIWALAFLLASPELDIKMLVTDSNDTLGKAKIAAKFLDIAGRPDIPIGIGKQFEGTAGAQLPWAEDYDLVDYPGQVFENGISKMGELIKNSEDEIIIFTVGPVPNIQELLSLEPAVTDNARVIAMSGSIDKGYNNSDFPVAEYNVKAYAEAAHKMYSAEWDVLIAPLDTAGIIKLEGEQYRSILNSESSELQAIIEGYRIWNQSFMGGGLFDPDNSSSTLYDTLPIYLAIHPENLLIRNIKVKVTKDGFTKRDSEGYSVRAALRWKNMIHFKNFLTERLMSL